MGATHEIALRGPGEPKRRGALPSLGPTLCFLFFFFNLFCIGVQLINKVVTVSREQLRNSAIHSKYPFFPKLPSHPGSSITLSRVPWAMQQWANSFLIHRPFGIGRSPGDPGQACMWGWRTGYLSGSVDPTYVLGCIQVHIQLFTLTCCVAFRSLKMEIVIIPSQNCSEDEMKQSG